MGPAHSVTEAKSRETEKQRMERATSVGDKVKNLIGMSFFHLLLRLGGVRERRLMGGNEENRQL